MKDYFMEAPCLQFDPQILLKAQGKTVKGIQLVILDVDGVLTDGSLYYMQDGEVLKAFNVQDGLGLVLLREAGFKIAVITGRNSPALRSRFSDLKIQHVFYDVKDKAKVANELLIQLGISWEQVAVMGDDWPDIPLFKKAAFSVAPPSAHIEAKTFADYITEKEGGHGAVREFCDILLLASGFYDEMFNLYTCKE